MTTDGQTDGASLKGDQKECERTSKRRRECNCVLNKTYGLSAWNHTRLLTRSKVDRPDGEASQPATLDTSRQARSSRGGGHHITMT